MQVVAPIALSASYNARLDFLSNILAAKRPVVVMSPSQIQNEIMDRETLKYGCAALEKATGGAPEPTEMVR